MLEKIRINEIRKYLDKENFSYRYIGSDECSVNGFSSLIKYKRNTFTWLKKQENWNNRSDIQLIIVQEGCRIDAANQIISKESKNIFFSLIHHFFSDSEQEPSIGQYTVIGQNVLIDENVIIGNNCSIVGDIHIGSGSIIEDHVVIRNKVEIGARCHIQSFSVLGEDGFGYLENEEHKKTMIKHYGGLNIGSDVFIGAHTNVARGVIDDTIIGNGVIIAPSSHIGHNNRIDNDVIFICSQSYGSVHIGENAYIVGSIVRNQCTVGKNVMIGMGSVVTKDIQDNKVAMGSPARETGNRYK